MPSLSNLERKLLEVVDLLAERLDVDPIPVRADYDDLDDIVSQLQPGHIKIIRQIYEAEAVSPATKKSRDEMGIERPHQDVMKLLVDLGLVDSKPARMGMCLTATGVLIAEKV